MKQDRIKKRQPSASGKEPTKIALINLPLSHQKVRVPLTQRTMSKTSSSKPVMKSHLIKPTASELSASTDRRVQPRHADKTSQIMSKQQRSGSRHQPRRGMSPNFSQSMLNTSMASNISVSTTAGGRPAGQKKDQVASQLKKLRSYLGQVEDEIMEIKPYCE